MSSWYWISEGSMRVDVDELVLSASHAGASAKAFRSALVQLLELSLGSDLPWDVFGRWSELLQTPHGPLLSDLTAQASALTQETMGDLQVLIAEVKQQEEWLAQAAAIYATAEVGVEGYLKVCGALADLGCPTDLSLGMSGWVGLAFAAPGYVGAFMGKDSRPPGAGLEMQNRMVAAIGDPKQFADAAVEVSKWWNLAGAVAVGIPGGVVVAGPAGTLAWRERLGDLRSDSAVRDSQDKRVQKALERLEQAQSQPSQRVEVPTAASSLLGRIAQSGGSANTGEIQILEHREAGTSSSTWTVVIRGTQAVSPGNHNPQDMESNFQTVAGLQSDQKIAVETAMEMAGIGEGEAVEFVGHSQGGAVALALSASSAIRSKYRIVSVLTAGAPTGGAVSSPRSSAAASKPLGKSPRVLNLENLSDLVPALDGSPPPAGQNVTNAYFDARGLSAAKETIAHSPTVYVEALEELEKAAVTDPMAEKVAQWNRARVDALGLTEETQTEARFYRTTRVR